MAEKRVTRAQVRGVRYHTNLDASVREDGSHQLAHEAHLAQQSPFAIVHDQLSDRAPQTPASTALPIIISPPPKTPGTPGLHAVMAQDAVSENLERIYREIELDGIQEIVETSREFPLKKMLSPLLTVLAITLLVASVVYFRMNGTGFNWRLPGLSVQQPTAQLPNMTIPTFSFSAVYSAGTFVRECFSFAKLKVFSMFDYMLSPVHMIFRAIRSMPGRILGVLVPQTLLDIFSDSLNYVRGCSVKGALWRILELPLDVLSFLERKNVEYFPSKQPGREEPVFSQYVAHLAKKAHQLLDSEPLLNLRMVFSRFVAHFVDLFNFGWGRAPTEAGVQDITSPPRTIVDRFFAVFEQVRAFLSRLIPLGFEQGKSLVLFVLRLPATFLNNFVKMPIEFVFGGLWRVAVTTPLSLVQRTFDAIWSAVKPSGMTGTSSGLPVRSAFGFVMDALSWLKLKLFAFYDRVLSLRDVSLVASSRFDVFNIWDFASKLRDRIFGNCYGLSHFLSGLQYHVVRYVSTLLATSFDFFSGLSSPLSSFRNMSSRVNEDVSKFVHGHVVVLPETNLVHLVQPVLESSRNLAERAVAAIKSPLHYFYTDKAAAPISVAQKEATFVSEMLAFMKLKAFAAFSYVCDEMVPNLFRFPRTLFQSLFESVPSAFWFLYDIGLVIPRQLLKLSLFILSIARRLLRVPQTIWRVVVGVVSRGTGIKSDIGSFDESTYDRLVRDVIEAVKPTIKEEVASAVSQAGTSAANIENVRRTVSDDLAELKKAVSAEIMSNGQATVSSLKSFVLESVDAVKKEMGARAESTLHAGLSSSDHRISLLESEISRSTAESQQRAAELNRRVTELDTVYATKIELRAAEASLKKSILEVSASSNAAVKELTGKLSSVSDDVSSQKQAVATGVAKTAAVESELKSLHKQFSQSLDAQRVKNTEFEHQFALSVQPQAIHKGLLDFAADALGGYVIKHSFSYSPHSWFSIRNPWRPWEVYAPNPASTILSSDMEVGRCWAMSGSKGFALVRLRVGIVPTSIAIEHVAHEAALHVNSAPRKFSVSAMRDDWDPSETSLGTFEFKLAADSPSQQVFPVSNKVSGSFQLYRLNIESNYGNPDFTCVYRFRVYGNLPLDASPRVGA
eukprot:ANDGO_03676.mRNA.1 Protein SAD1/UNC-84 domain protein 2